LFKLRLPLFVWFRNDLTQIWDFCYAFVVFFKIRRRLPASFSGGGCPACFVFGG
jgi:hypothetical protein